MNSKALFSISLITVSTFQLVMNLGREGKSVIFVSPKPLPTFITSNAMNLVSFKNFLFYSSIL